MAVRLGLAASRRRSNAAPVFCFHNVVQDEIASRHGDRSLHLAASSFRSCLDAIVSDFTIVPLEELAERLGSGRSLRGLAALTFDDAYEGVFRHAAPLLGDRRLPWTVFVVSGACSAPAPFWWDELGEGDMLDPTTREEALTACGGEASEIRRRFPRAQAISLPDELLPAPWNRLGSAQSGDMTIGAHTVTHPNLAALGEAAAREELEGSRRLIAERLGTAPLMVSYPYGRTGPATIRLAREAGYRIGMTMRAGRIRPGEAPLALPRINVPASISADALACWAVDLRWPHRS